MTIKAELLGDRGMVKVERDEIGERYCLSDNPQTHKERVGQKIKWQYKENDRAGHIDTKQGSKSTESAQRGLAGDSRVRTTQEETSKGAAVRREECKVRRKWDQSVNSTTD